MKLVDFIVELENKSKAITRLETNELFELNSELLRLNEKGLFDCDEFKNVARVNYIDLPHYLVDCETGEPIATNREFLGGNTTSKEVFSYLVNPGQELKFNKIIDLYSITLHKRYNTSEEVKKHGVWVYPTDFNMETLAPTNKITVIWDPNQLKEALEMVGNSETPKDRLKRMFDNALDSMEPNLPCEYVLRIRCSERSVLNQELKVNVDTKMIEDEVLLTPSVIIDQMIS